MMKIEIQNHHLVHGERNPLEEQATIRVEFAGKTYNLLLEATSLRNMNLAESHLTAQWSDSRDKHLLMDEERHEALFTFDQEHPPEKEEDLGTEILLWKISGPKALSGRTFMTREEAFLALYEFGEQTRNWPLLPEEPNWVLDPEEFKRLLSIGRWNNQESKILFSFVREFEAPDSDDYIPFDYVKEGVKAVIEVENLYGNPSTYTG